MGTRQCAVTGAPSASAYNLKKNTIFVSWGVSYMCAQCWAGHLIPRQRAGEIYEIYTLPARFTVNLEHLPLYTALPAKNPSLDLLAPFGSAPFLTRSKKGARSKKGQTKVVSSFHGDTRRNGDGTWKGGVDSSMIPNADRPDDNDFYSNVRDDEFYYGSDYSRVCTVDNKSM